MVNRLFDGDQIRWGPLIDNVAEAWVSLYKVTFFRDDAGKVHILEGFAPRPREILSIASDVLEKLYGKDSKIEAVRRQNPRLIRQVELLLRPYKGRVGLFKAQLKRKIYSGHSEYELELLRRGAEVARKK